MKKWKLFFPRMKSNGKYALTFFSKITISVFIAHLLILLIFCIPKISKAKTHKIAVKTSEIKKRQILKSEKKIPKTPLSLKKTRKVIRAKNTFEKEIEKCFQTLKNIEKPTNASDLEVPQKIKKLNIQTIELDLNYKDPYKLKLINFLQEKLELPEFGTVKLELSINEKGMLTELIILQSKNDKNVQYLKNQLRSLIYPCFNHNDNQKIKNYIINFSNLE